MEGFALFLFHLQPLIMLPFPRGKPELPPFSGIAEELPALKSPLFSIQKIYFRLVG